MKTLQVSDLHKNFGKIKAVDGISFAVEEGEIFGFLGPNGAGKSTTIKCIMDFIRPSSGSIAIFGLDSQKDSVMIKKDIGYLPAEVFINDNWTGKDHIDYLKGIKGSSLFQEDLLHRLDLDINKKARNLSTGNRQKLAFILATSFSPKLLILDEPTRGFDPLLQDEVHKILLDLNAKGTTIFLSSHDLYEVEKICSNIGIIKSGKLVAIERVEEIKSKKIYTANIKFKDGFHKEDFAIDGITIKSSSENSIVLKIKGDIDQVIKKAATYTIDDIEITKSSLEEIFLEFYRNNDANNKKDDS